MVLRKVGPTYAPDFAIFGVSAFFLLCPILNPIVTLYLLRPVRTEFFRIIGGLIKSNKITAQVVSLQPAAPNSQMIL